MRLRSYVVSRGRDKIMKIAAEVVFAVEEFILEKIFTSVFALIHRVSGDCCVAVGQVWILSG